MGCYTYTTKIQSKRIVLNYLNKIDILCIFVNNNTQRISGNMEVRINFANNVGASNVIVLYIDKTITPVGVTHLVNTLQHHLLDHFILNGNITDAVHNILRIFSSPFWEPFLTAAKSLDLDYEEDSLNRDYREWYPETQPIDICITIEGVGHLTDRVAIRTDHRGIFYIYLSEPGACEVLEEALSSVVRVGCLN